jgi:hypothetical protein
MSNLPLTHGGTQLVTLSLFLVSLSRNEKFQDTFNLTTLRHILIETEAYRFQAGLMQCYNCQTFGYVWANCKQHPLSRCFWCGGGHFHK